jgi:tetratricopeptide (TPR) repeat protein
MKRRWLSLPILCSSFLLLIILAGLVSWYLRSRARAVEPPTVLTDINDPAVAFAVEKARTQVCRLPRSADAWGRLGMVLLAHLYQVEADACFAQAQSLDPADPRWPYFRALTLGPGDPDASIAVLRRAVELWGDAAGTARLKLAEVLLEQGRLDEAETHFRRVMEKNPEDLRAHYGLGRLCHLRGDLEAGLLHLRRAAASPFARRGSHALLAEIYERLCDRQAATQEFQQLADLPDDPIWPDLFLTELEQLRVGKQAHLGKVKQLIGERRVQEAIALLRQTAQEYPDSERAWLALGQLLAEQRNFAAAEQALRAAVRLVPDSVEAYFLLGVSRYQQEDDGAAADCFRRAVALKPDHALAHYSLSQCLSRQGDRIGAIAALGAAVRCKPDLVEAHTALADLLARNGCYADALVHLRHALALDPGNARARKLLGQVLGTVVQLVIL